jgi:hypothetical protein
VRSFDELITAQVIEHLDLDRVRCQRGQAILVRFARPQRPRMSPLVYQHRLRPVPVPITVAVDGSDPEALGAVV